MRKIVVLLFAVSFVNIMPAQVFNTAQTLKKGTFSVGVEPMLMTKSGSDFILFGYVGYGLTSGIDLSAKTGILSNEEYYGADLEFGLTKHLSFSAGAHIWGDFGLDATFLASFNLAKNVSLYFGGDSDLNFGGNTYVSIWAPIGVEVGLNKSLAFLMEASIGLNDNAPHMFGGGVTVYF